jgi:hypothetical protein
MKRIFAPLLIAALLASSESSAEPTPAERDTARRLMDEGKERTKARDLEGALVAYSKAHGIMHVPSTGISLARTHLALGHLVEARDVAFEVMRFPKEKNEPAVFESARAEAREIESSVKDRIPTVRIRIKGPSPTKLSVDGAQVSPQILDAPVSVNPGHHVITAANKDGVEKKGEIDVVERDRKTLDIELPEESKTPPVDPNTGNQNANNLSLPLLPLLDKGGGPGTAIMIGGFALAAVGAGVGTVTGLMTLSKADSVKPQCENGKCDPSVKSDLDSGKTLGLVSTISFAAAGVGVVVAIVGIAWPSGSAKGKAGMRPYVGPGSLGVGGEF